MTVKELRELLFKIDDQNLEIRCEIMNVADETNYWLTDIEISNTGSSGYEEEGEVRLIFSE